MKKIKNRFSNWKWWTSLTVALPLIAILLLISAPLFIAGVVAVVVAEWYVKWMIGILYRLHVFAHGWAKGINYDGVLVEFTIEEKNND